MAGILARPTGRRDRSRRKTTIAIANLQAKDIDRVTKRASVLSSRIYRMAVDAARANFVHHKTVIRVRDFDPELKQKALDEFLDLICYSYLLRVKLHKRRRAKTKSLTMNLSLKLASEVHDLAEQIADDFELDYGNIRKRFQGIAGDALDASLADIRETMNSALEEATVGSRPTPYATEDVISALRDKGIVPKANSYVETLVRTHASIAYGAASRVSFQNDLDVWGWEYVTVGDDRVRPSHFILDGIQREKNDEFWDKFWPPNGWNCRCQAVAIYDPETTQSRLPDGISPDEGFDFDPADLIQDE